MQTRAITGFFFVVVMLAMLLSGVYAYTLFFTILTLMSVREFYGLINDNAIKLNDKIGLVLSFFVFLSTALYLNTDYEGTVFIVILPMLAFVYIRELYSRRKSPFLAIAYTLFGVLYVVLPFACFYSLAYIEGNYNFHYPLGFLVMLWSSDTGAYLVGRSFGRRKLFERHSPKKTWEGFVGGMLLCLLTGFILSNYYTGIATWQWLISALIIAVFGTFGDLTESMLKRSYDVKDTGSLLPGHGGLLDRFDGLLLAAPLVYAFLKLTY